MINRIIIHRLIYVTTAAALLWAFVESPATLNERSPAPPTTTGAINASAPLIISGPARVIDGDTVVVKGVTVRLKGVDAAELGTPQGEKARNAMMSLVRGELACRLTGEKTHGREVGYCVTPHAVDINQAIIAQGAALACPRYDARYLPFEQASALAVQMRASYCESRK